MSEVVSPRQITITGRGLDAEVWRPLLAAARPLLLGQLPASQVKVAIVVPHPDDETLGAGGLLHRLGNAAVVTAVFVSDGAAAYPGTSNAQSRQLAGIRQEEALAALTMLGVEPVSTIFLDLPDGEVAAEEEELAGRLEPLLADQDLCLAPWPHDPHPDHQATGRAAAAAISQHGSDAGSAPPRLWQYPIWMRHKLHPDDPIVARDRLRVLRLGAGERAAKQAAIQAYASQLSSPYPGYGPVLPDHVLALFADGLEPYFLPSEPTEIGDV